MSNYNAHGLAVTVKQRANHVAEVGAWLQGFADALDVDANGQYDVNVAQHAEERLLARADLLAAAAQNLRYLAGRYTLTGEHRVEAEQRGERS